MLSVVIVSYEDKLLYEMELHGSLVLLLCGFIGCMVKLGDTRGLLNSPQTDEDNSAGVEELPSGVPSESTRISEKVDASSDASSQVDTGLASEETREHDSNGERDDTFLIAALPPRSSDGPPGCAAEPPSILNGRPLDFERKSGSTVQYVCSKNFFLLGSSSVLCESGNWEGQPPTCVYFDDSFVLDSAPFASPDFSCYSDSNYGKIEYSQVFESGRDEMLPESFSKETFLKKSRSNDTKYSYAARIGAFQCELTEGHGSMKIVTLNQGLKSAGLLIASDPFKVASIGDSVALRAEVLFERHLPLRWKHNGVDVPAWYDQRRVEIPDVRPENAGIYECFYEGMRSEKKHPFFRVIVRSCKENYYGQNCDQKCPPCYNGGICHDLLGMCICPPGFEGTSCENSCEGTHFGTNCSNKCYSPMCSFRRFCKPDPYGCSCAPGYRGYACYEKCSAGWYGADCKQPCHCAFGDKMCNKYSGYCTGGCSAGWTGSSCQIKVAAVE